MTVYDFLPHAYCLAFNPLAILLHTAAVFLTAFVYLGFFVLLANFLRVTDLRVRQTKRGLWLLAAFVGMCGIVHLIEAMNVWLAWYWLEIVAGMVRAWVSICAIAFVYHFRHGFAALIRRMDLEAIDG